MLLFQKGLGDFSFLPFTVLLAGFFLFTLKFVPETKNRTIEDISRTWFASDSYFDADKDRRHLSVENGTSNGVYEQPVDISSEKD